MFKVFRDAFHIQDLRKKILFTLFVIVIFRIGSKIPVPFLDSNALGQMTAFGGGNLLGYLDVLSGGGLSQASLFALSVSPYINASIIMQLLTVAIPVLGRMQKEGEEGRKKIAQITRYVTVILGLLMGTAYYFLLLNQTDKDKVSLNIIKYTIGRNGGQGWFAFITIVLVFAAGSALMMWLGEQINEKGIGNGISILLFAGIVSRGPYAFGALWAYFNLALQGQVIYFFLVPAVVILFIVLIGFIVLMDQAERRIPVQYAKRVVGRKMYGGQNTHIPIKVNMSGVLPIIFASTFISIPGTIFGFINPKTGSTLARIKTWFDFDAPVYAILYFLLIIGFSYFYVTIQYDPIEMANNLKKNNGTIPGIRPGRPTSEFISRILYKITLIGALFLGVIAILPIIVSSAGGMRGLALGGTSILIIVGVAIETVRQIESQMLMRHYKGFLE